MNLTGHNHVTRDIKPLGKCPACDEYHHSQGVTMTYESIVQELDGLIDSLDEHVTTEDVGLALGSLRANVFEMAKAQKAYTLSRRLPAQPPRSRPEVDPTDDEREALAQMIANAEAHPNFKRNPSVMPFAGDYRAADEILTAGFRRTEVTEPQGEPSDAQVIASVRAYREHRNLSGYMNSTIHYEGMRAALRAAGEPTPINGKWVCGKCAREVALGHDDGQIPKHHRTCAKSSLSSGEDGAN